MPKELVIDFLGANSWTCLQSADYQNHRSDNQIPSQANDSTHYLPVWANAEDYLESTKTKWDYVFSIAAFEHLLKFPKIARLLPTVVKSGGTLFSIFAPIWSGPWGQHYTDGVPSRFGQSPNGEWTTQLIFNSPWDHLIYGAKDYLQIYTAKFDRDFAEELTYQTFHSPQINRLHFEDYLAIVSNTHFKPRRLHGIFNLNPSQNDVWNSVHQGCIKKFEQQNYSNFTSSGIVMLLDR